MIELYNVTNILYDWNVILKFDVSFNLTLDILVHFVNM